MRTYSQQDILRVAKRIRNAKRSYLLVNPLQGKHVPVSPSKSLAMMHTLGDSLAAEYPGTKLVIGFAETATAIGAAVASRFSADCVYLHTTREVVPEVREWALFSEEHSHAVEQKLCVDGLLDRIQGTQSVIFVDDEISTGKTLINMIGQLRVCVPCLTEKRLVAASLLNRLSPEDEKRLSDQKADCRWLVRFTGGGEAEAVEALPVEEAKAVEPGNYVFAQRALNSPPLPDPRRGVPIGNYLDGCRQMAWAFLEAVGAKLAGVRRAVVLGTEECMYPALVLGEALEARGLSVLCHATTRSPIGICGASGYPIVSGSRLSSFYEGDRDTFLYNFSGCDALVVVSDAPSCRPEALNELAAAWAPYGFQMLFFVQGGCNVWYL